MSLEQPTQEHPPSSEAGAASGDEMSGQWIRDQLKDVAESSETNPPNPSFVGDDNPQGRAEEPATASEDPLGPIVANLAHNISAAVTKPIEDLERRRVAERDQLSHTVQEQAGRLEEAFAALRRLEEANERLSETLNRQESEARDHAAQAGSRIDAVQADFGRERDAILESIGALRGELEGFSGRLSNSERSIEEQRTTLARIEALEHSRGEALAEVGRLFGSLQGALQSASRPESQGD